MSAYPDLTRKLLLSILLLSAVCVSCLGVDVLLNFVGGFWLGWAFFVEGMEHSTQTQLLFILSRGVKFNISCLETGAEGAIFLPALQKKGRKSVSLRLK